MEKEPKNTVEELRQQRAKLKTDETTGRVLDTQKRDELTEQLQNALNERGELQSL